MLAAAPELAGTPSVVAEPAMLVQEPYTLPAASRSPEHTGPFSNGLKGGKSLPAHVVSPRNVSRWQTGYHCATNAKALYLRLQYLGDQATEPEQNPGAD